MSWSNIQHPDITRAERDGLPDQPTRRCPCCGQECNDYFKQSGDIIGCDMCVDIVDAYED